MAETTINKKTRAFDGEVAIAVAQLHFSACCSVPSRQGLSRRAFQPKPIRRASGILS
jgi:hypothetical protein